MGLVRRAGGLRLEVRSKLSFLFIFKAAISRLNFSSAPMVVCQDVMVIDRSVLYGVPGAPDVHDAMRLDVDNMSYEVTY